MSDVEFEANPMRGGELSPKKPSKSGKKKGHSNSSTRPKSIQLKRTSLNLSKTSTSKSPQLPQPPRSPEIEFTPLSSTDDADEAKEKHSRAKSERKAAATSGSGGGSSSSSSTHRGDSKRDGGGKEKSGKDKGEKDKGRFSGVNIIQYGMWAHYMAYGSAWMCLCMGIFALAWTDAQTYGCKVEGKYINSIYLYNANGTCPTTFKRGNGDVVDLCCDPNSKSSLEGDTGLGALYILYSLLIFAFENTEWGYGLWFPNDSLPYYFRMSPVGLLHIVVGLAGCSKYVTSLAGTFLLTTGLVYNYAAFRQEAGDGGRAMRKKAVAKAVEDKTYQSCGEKACAWCVWFFTFNPFAFCRRIYNEDKLSSYVWTFIFIFINVFLWVYTALFWVDLVEEIDNDLLNGKMQIEGSDPMVDVNRVIIRYGNLSPFAAVAKSFGALLNLNCALILLPITKLLLTKLTNLGVSASSMSHKSDVLSRLFARPLTRFIPLSKNIEFHKMCALAIFISTWGHLIGHFLNLIWANAATGQLFRTWGWNATQFLLGGIVTYAMFIIYTAAPDVVRYSKYEIFFKSHHFFIVFFVVMFIHGPIFFYWSAIPVLLYILERYYQTQRGSKPFLVCKVEWISPVIALYFRPVFKEDFQFKEGQYLYLNCPHISPSEWHPFTISSAADDLNNGPRICLETGEDVYEVPRPAGMHPSEKWNKFCLVSKDWRHMDPKKYLDRGDTGYNDFVSVHIKVIGLDEPKARSWTRKFKEYLELMSPGAKFPFYFSRRDPRGEVLIGKKDGPDRLPILRVDGPHSAPAEHYANYGTVMLIGAGIGLTPCASILCAMTKYRWKKNFSPEILHFYWVVRHNELDSFQWLVHMLTEICFEVKRGKHYNQIDRRYYLEINIYVTAAPKEPNEVAPLKRPKAVFNGDNACQPSFTADQLYGLMVNPPVESRGQIKKMKESKAANRLQDIWVWNGRPQWDEIFREAKESRQHSDIGVCFCGAPVIGADLRAMCEKHSDIDEDVLFSLHKENF